LKTKAPAIALKFFPGFFDENIVSMPPWLLGNAHITKTKSANFWRPLSLPRRQNFLI